MYKIQLNKIFRQADPVDGMILNRVRTGTQTVLDYSILNSRVQEPPKNAVILSPLKRMVPLFNERELSKLNTKEWEFHATETGKFRKLSDEDTPFPRVLKLREWCRVIITKNLKTKIKGEEQSVVNGDTGTFLGMDKYERIMILLDRTSDVVHLKRDRVGQYADSVIQTEDHEPKLVTKEIAKFVQYPVELGYSITAHKSQGSTIPRVHLELPPPDHIIMRTPGLFYVAISRVPALSCLTLSRKIVPSDVVSNVPKEDNYQQFELIQYE